MSDNADERTLLRRLYATPKLHYIMAPKKVAYTELSRIWHQKAGDGYAPDTLRTLGHEENWKDARTKHQADLEEQSTKAQLAATGESAVMIVERYSAILNKVIIGITEFLEQHPLEFKTSDKAIGMLCKVMMADHEICGRAVLKIEDVTGKNRPLKEQTTAELIRQQAQARANGGAGPH